MKTNSNIFPANARTADASGALGKIIIML